MSRIQDVIESVEKGEPVDYGRVLALQALDVARLDELYAEESSARQDQADEQLAERITSGR